MEHDQHNAIVNSIWGIADDVFFAMIASRPDKGLCTRRNG